MFEASVDGQPYDLERWGQYFKPAGMGGSNSTPADDDTPARVVSAPSKVAVATAAPATAAATEETAPWGGTTEAATSKPSAQANDILAMIRNRQKSA